MASSSEASCISDPNFAVICAFLERFAKSCGITYPTFAELQEMLENAEQVPQELIELHIKLLRKARKTVFLEKWERALIKFCHTYSSQDGWEIERFGYKKSRLEVKLRVLKMLLEGQFDLNNKFKASINTLESEELRSKPLGRDKLGRIYWLQFDPLSNIRVYREDLDEESWTLVAKDRATLVQLLQELSGDEYPIELNLLNEDSNSLETGKPTLDTGQFETSDYNIQSDSFEQNNEIVNVIVEKDSLEVEVKESFPKEESDNGFDDSKNFQTSNKIFDNEEKTGQGNENEVNMDEVDLDKHAVNMFNGEAPIKDEVVVGEAIEEPIMYVIGEGKGEDCNTGNPDNDEKSEECSKSIKGDRLTNKQATGSAQDPSELDSLSSVNSPDKSKPTPKLWSIDAICGVNSGKQTDSEVYNIDRQESSDGKLIQKNFSKFSIDSVLEKKDLNSVFSDSSLSKFPVISSGDPLPDKLQCNKLDSSSLKLVHNDQDNEKPTSVEDSQVLSCSVNFKTENLSDEVKKEELVNQTQTSKCLENISNERDLNLRGNFSKIFNVEENVGKSNKKLMEFEADKKEESSEEKREKSLSNEVEFYPLKTAGNNELIAQDVSAENDLKKSDDISEEEKKESNTETKESKMAVAVTEEILNDEKFQSECVEGIEEKKTTYPSNESFEGRNLQSENFLAGQIQRKNETFLEAKMEENPKNIDEIVVPTVNIDEDSSAKETIGSTTIFLGRSTDEKDLENMEMEKAETIKTSDVTEIEENAENFKGEVSEVTFENNDNPKIGHPDLPENVNSDKFKSQNVENNSKKSFELKDEAIKSEANENLFSCNASNEDEGKASFQELYNSNEEAESNKETKQTTDEKVYKEAVKENEKTVSRASDGSENTNKEDKIEELLKVSENVAEEEEFTACESSKVTRRRKKEVVPQRVSLRNRRITEGENTVHESLEKTIRTKGGRRAILKENDGITCGLRANKNRTKDGKDEFEEVQNDETETNKELPAGKDTSNETGEAEDFKQAEQEVTKDKKVRKRFSKKYRKRRRRNVEEVTSDVQDKGSKQSKTNQVEDKDDAKNKKKGRPKREETAGRSKSRQIPAREIKLLGIKDADTELPSIRQSRRIAQIKMKEEAERRRMEALQLESFKNKKNKSKAGKKRQKKNADSDSFEEKYEKEEYDSGEDKLKPNKDDKKTKRRKKKDKLVFNELNPWLSSSGSSSADEEEDEIDDEPHEDEELVFKSDHEFSPESDIEDPDYKPIKRARTAKVEESRDDAGKYDDTACEKCGNNDHPEWILLCDKCDKGWHASCVRPALMVVPEGDWFCPPCEHSALIQKLQESLAQYDRCQKQRENEELRKKRLAFVGISLDNVLPSTKKKSSQHEDEGIEAEDEKKDDISGSDSGSDSENSYSSSRSDDSSEPVYQLRERRSTVTSYRYNEYDELIKSALQDEIEAVKGAGNAGRGKDINNIVNAQKDIKEEEGDKEQAKKKVYGSEKMEVDWKDSIGENGGKGSCQNERVENDDLGNNSDGEDEEEEDENVVDEIPPVVPKYNSNNNKKKKSKSSKITSLDFTSEEEDHNSDSDFKGTSSEEESDYSLLSESESSDDTRRRKKSGEGPLRRSTRARVSRYDRDFINDESEEDSPKRKKHRKIWISSESSDSDRSWGRRKRKGNRSLYRSSKKKSPKKGKRKKQKKELLDFENEDSMTIKKSKNRKIKYGGLDCLDEEKVLTRRTRGKKINYQEMNGSDSDEDSMRGTKKSSRVIESDDDFVAENEKDDDAHDRESEEIESSIDEGDEDRESGEKNPGKKETGSNGKKNKILEKIKKKKWVIPDPDDFSENDLMEDEQLDEFVEELEDLDEEEEEILGNIIESGDVPTNELKAAIKRAKEERRLKKDGETKEKLILDNKSVQMTENSVAYKPAQSDCANAGNVKFPKIGKVKITPSRAELASQFGGMQNQTTMPLSGKPISFIQSTTTSFIPEKSSEGLGPAKEKHPDSGNSVGGFLLRTLQSDQKLGSVSNVNIPSNHSAVKGEASVLRPYASYSVETASSGSLNVMAMMNSQSPGGSGDNRCTNMIPMSVNSGCSIPQYNAFQGIVPPSRMSSYSATIPTTVTGLSNEDQLRRKPGPKPGTKNKRKLDELSSELDSCGESSESGDVRSILPQGDDFIPLKGVQDSPPKKKGRGRGKKQLLAEAQAKQDVTAPLVQSPVSYPPQGVPSEGGSVITRMLGTPQGSPTFPGNDSNRFSPGPRNRLPFRPALPPHFANSPRPIATMRLRPPVAGNSIFHTSHPLDPSPSGGGAISIPVTSSGLTKPPPPGLTLTRAPGMTLMPRFPPDPNIRHPFSPQNSPPRPEFSSFPSFYGNFPPPSSSVPNNEDSSFTNPSFPDSYEESQISGNSKPFDDETGGEFGGLASYFASQREDDLDT